jgi:hypothetical protein
MDERFQFILLPERSAVYSKAEKMLSSVQECICFLGLTKRMIAWLSSYCPLLEKTLARKVGCRMIMPKPETKRAWGKTFNILQKHAGFALRLTSEQPKADFSVWDRKEVLITTSPIDTSTPAPILWSNNKGLVGLCQDYFECLWVKSE